MGENKRRKIKFVSDFPEILQEWDYSENTISPDKVSFGCSKKVSWICKNGHKWQDTPAHRIGEKRTCPYCNGSKLWKGFNDFQTKFPEKVKEWDYDKNEKGPSEFLATTSNIKVWWICPKCGNHYLMSPRDRGYAVQGCPVCSHKKIADDYSNSFAFKYPKIANEWDYKKNGLEKPEYYFPRSTKKFWWKCKKGHSWTASIASRVAGSGCPICSNKLTVKGINDLFTKRPDLEKYWDYEKNLVKPDSLAEKSQKKVWWKCENGHSFCTKVSLMLNAKIENICPICSNRKVLKGYNDLATTNPELLKEWNYERNSFSPYEIHTFNNRKIWWKCEKGHEWLASVYSRAHNKNGCPICSNQKVLVGYNDLGTLYPDIKKYWDYHKNKTKPEDYAGIYSNKSAWFICAKGHSWKTGIQDFTRGSRCPVCCNKIIIKGINDISTTHPKLLREWDFEKNTKSPYTLSSGSDKKVWWKCENGHSWSATINSRASGRGCPICAKENQSSLPEKAVFYYTKLIFKDALENIVLDEIDKRELDIYIPSERIGIEFDGFNWHRDIQKDLKKDNLCKEAGITLIRIREKGCPIYKSDSYKIDCERIHSNLLLLEQPLKILFTFLQNYLKKHINFEINIEKDYTKINELLVIYNKKNSLTSLSPQIAKEWNYDRNGTLTPDMFKNSSQKLVWWKCEHGHEWRAVIGSRTGKNHNGCPYCSNQKVLEGFNDLKTKYKEVSDDWDYEKNGDLKPSNVTGRNNKKVWWICPKGHSYQATIFSRTRNKSGCPICAGQKAEKGISDLATLYPELLKEWDYDKNGDLKPNEVMPGTERKVWWICPNGHSYQAIPRSRTKLRTGCPICKNLKVIEGVNDFKTMQPELLKDWDYEKNERLPETISGAGGTHYKASWKCHVCGHEWKTTIASRVKLKTGCPNCYKERAIRRVICVETGKIYRSTTEAAKEFGIKSQNICVACRKATRTSAGFHWKYLDK